MHVHRPPNGEEDYVVDLKFPVSCRKCGLKFIDSLDIAVHIGRLKSDIYPRLVPCRKGAAKVDVTQVT